MKIFLCPTKQVKEKDKPQLSPQKKLKLKHTIEINNMKATKISRRPIFRSGTERSELLQHSGRGMGYFTLVIPIPKDSFNVRLSRRDIP